MPAYAPAPPKSAASEAVRETVDAVRPLRLLVRPVQESSEGAQDFALRQAWVNGLARVSWLSAPLRPHLQLRVCPHCLAENERWNARWRDTDLPLCPTHRVWLLSHCHGCGQALRWPRTRLLQCACGADLREAPSATLGPALRACLAATPPPPLAVLLWLGAWATHGPQGKPLKKASVTGVAERARILERGAEIVEGWPQTWLAEMARHRRGGKEGPLQPLGEAWPGLPAQIRRLPDDVWRDRVWAAVDTLVGRSHGSDHPLVGRHPRLSQRPPTQKATAQALGIGVARLQASLARRPSEAGLPATPSAPPAGLHERHTAAGRVRRLIAPELVAQLAQDLSAWMTLREAARLIGCGRKRMPALVEAGCLAGHPLGPGAAIRLRRSEVEALRDRILQPARGAAADIAGQDDPSKSGSTATTWVPLSRVWRLKVPAPESGGFVEAVAQGRVQVRAEPSATDWRHVWVAADDVDAWRAEEQARAQDTLSLTEAARALGIKGEVAYVLADRGCLPTVTLRVGRRAARRVTAEAVREFARRYVTLSELTRPHRVHSRHALDWARERRLRVISGPRVDGARQYLVERPGSEGG